MAKLYPPHIEGALPAFCGNTFSIPFEHSRAVSQVEIGGYYFILKDIQQSTVIASQPLIKEAAAQDESGNWWLTGSGINASQLTPGTFYKMQIAYVAERAQEIGFFSDVGIIKYIQEPEIKIVGLNAAGMNDHVYQYQLDYKCLDSTERLYSTEFYLAEGTQINIIDSSGPIIHDNNKDTIYVGYEDYEFLQELNPNQNYWIYAKITTTSGYEMATPFYPLSAKVGIPTINGRKITTKLDFDNGCIAIYASSELPTSMNGRFRLVRADESEDFSVWHRLVDISLSASNITANNPYLLWRDFTVEQGQNYTYALMQLTDANHFSTKIKADNIHADFEDSFLFDGDKQLRIRFDPKVSSFKVTVQEAKTDTIGGRYPIIQRNGYTNYKEFPISGLISHLSDPNGYFNKGIADIKAIDETTVVTDTDDALNGMNYSTNLNSKNVALERQFKLEVLDWLNNGKPKLFRSPTEGNYLVRLLNVSLSPVDTLGRMLHSFSCTAYEIDGTTPEKLIKHGIIKDTYLVGRFNYDLDRNFISYYLTNLSDRNLLEQQSELRGKEVTGAIFSIQNNSSDVYVNINNSDVKVSNSADAIYNSTITSLKKASPAHSSNYSTHDLVTLTYRNVLSNDAYNNLINDITSRAEVNQYYGFNYLTNFGDIKTFLQRIYKMICNVRPLISQVIEFTKSALQELFDLLHINVSLNDDNWMTQLYNLTADQLKKIVGQWFGGTCIASTVYQILDAAGNIIGYIDGNKGAWIKEGGQLVKGLAQATVSFIGQSNIIESTYRIVKETVFKDTDFSSTLTNIIANPFTCVDIIYKTGINTFNTVMGSVLPEFTTSSQNSFLNTVSSAAANLTPTIVNTCETIYDAFVTTLSNGGIPSSSYNTINSAYNNPGNSGYEAVNQIISQTVATGADLANKAIGLLTYATSSTTSTNLTEITAPVASAISSVFNGLFGGMY